MYGAGALAGRPPAAFVDEGSVFYEEDTMRQVVARNGQWVQVGIDPGGCVTYSQFPEPQMQEVKK